jgi:PAS domain S-box-containing protein
MSDDRSKTEKEARLEKLKSTILAFTTQGIVIVNNHGVIEYVNSAVGTILGSTDTVGLNILDFNTVKQSNMHKGIIKALNGISSEDNDEHYVSYTTGVEKVLDIIFNPVTLDDTSIVECAILIIQDVTQEYNLKLKMKSTYLSTIAALAEAVDARDEYTGEHS